jgi:CcmD family protein
MKTGISKNKFSFNKIVVLVATILFLPISKLYAQEPEMATIFYENGKIYVVIAVILIVFLGLATYLWSIDKKVSKLEKE